MQNILTIIKKLSRSLFVTFVFIVATILVTFFSVRYFLQISKEITENKKEIISLEERLKVLEKSATYISKPAATSLTQALPAENATILALSQIKKIAAENNTVINNVEVDITENITENLSTAAIKLTLENETINDFTTFFTNLSHSLPITSTQEITFKLDQEQIESRLEFNVYWAPFPATLPSLTTPLSELSSEEKEILSLIDSYDKFEQSTVPSLSPTTNPGRTNPFEPIEDTQQNIEP
ncbi:hypothetical protein A2191_00105 [Candidatus Woesebacteria bacterium RIFOXYA1_FULL_38_9]|nr:MAG: hypothetical protein A2191_00105 [Candidatus Woesebacteria bacterium RIFOXYA1_FULL_38_9]